MFSSFKRGFLTGGLGEQANEPEQPKPQQAESSGDGALFRERCKYIPVRLKYNERKYLRLVEAALGVCDYTTSVDSTELSSTDRGRAKRTHIQMEGICALLSSIIVGVDYERGQEVVSERDFKTNGKVLSVILELARRYKIVNPERMRSEYGKLMYLLQDTNLQEIQNILEFSCVIPVKTVYSELEEHNLLRMLDDPLLPIATATVVDDKKKSQRTLRSEIKRKYAAIDELGEKYSSGSYKEEEIKQCIYSIGDNNSYLAGSRDVIDQVIELLKEHFSPTAPTPPYSLAIEEGKNDARLTHSHERQYNYILQSLMLWREVTSEMFRLWWLAEADLLDAQNPYTLQDTGQGFQRVQQAPRTYEAMEEILARIQGKLDEWVGTSTIHMGDRNVPNALMFIDKYAQIPRILNPVVTTIARIDDLTKDPSIRGYFDDKFGGLEKLRKTILTDFFRSAFDGSGADNFFDAGSCIDGRLTSAWNWCSKLQTKDYYPIFKLAGFHGFDGTEGFGVDPSHK